VSNKREIDYSGLSRETLLHMLKRRDHQIELSALDWVRAAELAFTGDTSELRNRVALAKMKDVEIYPS
jgi:hypothetical protein